MATVRAVACLPPQILLPESLQVQSKVRTLQGMKAGSAPPMPSTHKRSRQPAPTVQQKALVPDWRCAASCSVEHKPHAAEQGSSWLGGASGAAASAVEAPGKLAALALLHEAPAGSQQPHLQEHRQSSPPGRCAPIAERHQARAGQQEQTSLLRVSQGASRPGSLVDTDAAASSDTTQHAMSQAAAPELHALPAAHLQEPVDGLPGAQIGLPTSRLRVSCADRTAVPVGLRWQTASGDGTACRHQLQLQRCSLTGSSHTAASCAARQHPCCCSAGTVFCSLLTCCASASIIPAMAPRRISALNTGC